MDYPTYETPLDIPTYEIPTSDAAMMNSELEDPVAAVERESARSADAVVPKEEDDKLHWFHLKTVLICGVGFFTDAYDLQVISSVKPMMAFARWPGKVLPQYQGDLNQHSVGSLPTIIDLEFSAIALLGTLSGQLFFGTMGDVMGRTGAYIITLTLMVGMTLLQVSASWGDETMFVALFSTWRFLLGVGIGGDYPLSAIISSEYSSTNLRGPMVAAVKAMQGIGTLTAACIGMAVSACYFQSTSENCAPDVACPEMDACWRIVMGIGAVPAALTFYLRWKLAESPRFKAKALEAAAAVEAEPLCNPEDPEAPTDAVLETTAPKAPEPKGEGHERISMASFCNFLGRRKNALILAGCAGAWFFQDMAYYSNSLFTPDILTNIGFNPTVKINGSGKDIATKAYKTCAGNAIICLCGAVPGYFPVIFLINKMGRKTIQFMGFSVMVITLLIMSAAYPQLLPTAEPPNAASINGTPWAYIMLFCLMFFFANFGPNTTEFILPGELFPTMFRSTCHGISSAAGKAGAVVGTFGFGWMVIGAKNSISSSYPLDTEINAMQLAVGLMSVVCFLGLLCTMLVPETTGLSLEEIVRKYHDWDDEVELETESKTGGQETRNNSFSQDEADGHGVLNNDADVPEDAFSPAAAYGNTPLTTPWY